MGIGKGQYGPVVVSAGDHAGKVAYYDDDEGGKAIVYLGTPLFSPYILISRHYLRKAKKAELDQALWRFAK